MWELSTNRTERQRFGNSTLEANLSWLMQYGIRRGFIQRAAYIQAGYGTLGVGGNIYETEVTLNKSFPFAFQFESEPVISVDPVGPLRMSVTSGNFAPGGQFREVVLANRAVKDTVY